MFDYGLVVLGQLPPEELLDNPYHVILLQNKLELVKTDLRMTQNLLQATERHYEKRIAMLEADVEYLRRQWDTTPSLDITINAVRQLVGEALQSSVAQEWNSLYPMSLLDFIHVGDPYLHDDLYAVRSRLKKGFAEIVSHCQYELLCKTLYDVIRKHGWLYD